MQSTDTVLSIQPYHTIRKSYENFSVIFNILVLAGMNQFSILGKRLPAAGAIDFSRVPQKKSL